MLGQLFIIGIQGQTLLDEEKKFIIENNIGGIILMGRNIGSPEQVHALCSEIQNLRHQMPERAPLYIGIDMEGGRVARLKAPWTIWPPLAAFGKLDSPTTTFDFGNAMGNELRAVGINLDFAPCVDIFSNPENKVIGDRSFGSDPELVAKHTSAIIRGYMKAGILTCAKHFPGHGNTFMDSHEDMPKEFVTAEHLEKFEMVPFQKAVKSRVDFIMTAHVLFEKIDPKWPCTLSKTIIQEYLRSKLRYQGIVITDDMDMGAMLKNYSREFIAIQAIEAGVDMLLYCNDPTSPVAALEGLTKALAEGRISKARIENSYFKILGHKKESLQNPDPKPFSEVSHWVGHPDHLKLAETVRVHP